MGGGEACPAGLLSAVHFFAVAGLDDEDNELHVFNRVNDSVISFSGSMEVRFTGQFLHALGSRVLTE